MVRRGGSRKRAIGVRLPTPLPLRPNQRWSLDFVHDQMTDGRRLRILAVVDDYTREYLALVVDTSISGIRVSPELGKIVAVRGRPAGIVSDNATELTSTAILAWSDRQPVAWHYIAPGKPVQNAFIESFNGRLRDELLNETLFRSLPNARVTLDTGAGLRCRAPAFEPRLADAVGLRGILAASVRTTRQDALAIWGFAPCPVASGTENTFSHPKTLVPRG